MRVQRDAHREHLARVHRDDHARRRRERARRDAHAPHHESPNPDERNNNALKKA